MKYPRPSTRFAAFALAGALVLMAGACSTAPEVEAAPEDTYTPPATTAPSVEAAEDESSPEPSETEEEAVRGSRGNPMVPGEARKLSNESAWKVSMKETEKHDGWIAAPFTIQVDWESLEDQGVPKDEPLYVTGSVFVQFVTKDGKTYDMLDQYEKFDNVYGYKSDWTYESEIYHPAKKVSGIVAVSVPKGEVKGGLWSIANGFGDRVFIAQK